jgi:hypothetical protein
VKAKGAPVFVESLKRRARFVALARARSRLPQIDVINDATPVPKRQAAVIRFRRHPTRDDPLAAALAGMFAAIGRPVPPRQPDGSNVL